MNVLVVEDDPDIAAYLGFILTHLGHKPTVTANEAGAIQVAERADIALLDFQLKATNGFIVAGLLRDRRPDLPIVFVTAQVELVDSDAVAELGACVLTKPFARADLEEALARAAGG